MRLFADGREVEISDNGRGIPVDVHPKYKKPALELILTTLHAGGKFEQGNYVHSGGLHGVGSSVVCALSSEMTVHVRRDGDEWRQTYGQGKATSKLKKVSTEKVRGSGTTVRFRPDPEIFGKLVVRRGRDPRAARGEDLPPPRPPRRLRRRDAEARRPRGVRARRRPRRLPPEGRRRAGEDPDARQRRSSSSREDEPRLELALAWTEATDEHVRSFVNGIPTPSGGTHENGLQGGHRQGRAELPRDARAPPEGGHPHGGGHPRGARRRSSPSTSSSRSSRGRRRTGSTTPRSRRRSTAPSARPSRTG